jgi:S-adenosylmethionine:tRNA ribosyltransferase-isomerase
LFQKPTGGTIEIFCLEPYEPITEYSTIMNKTGSLRWKCMIGGASKWKQGSLEKIVRIGNDSYTMTARLIQKLPDAYETALEWNPAELSFAEIIQIMGNTPLPPYIKRKAQNTDKERYQTIYAKHDGSVAAPTAGLHFTPDIFLMLHAKGISSVNVTLHVGAGTFKPVKAASMSGHEMHAEWIDVSIDAVKQLIEHFKTGIIAVGTTSVRTLESLYWMGVKVGLSPGAELKELAIKQWEVYADPLASSDLPVTASLAALLGWMEMKNLDHLFTTTQIIIAPGYKYRVPMAIITNFHQPQSTLLLLVAAAIGNDWRKVYQYAMQKDFRFLSYGDGSLLFLPGQNQGG